MTKCKQPKGIIMKQLLLTFLLLSFSIISQSLLAEESTSNGVVKQKGETYLAWHANSQKWIKLDSFWNKFTDENNGLTWQASDKYPTYHKVKEFDTFMVITNKGNCLMQFFHTRWRRANDVQRWDEQFNEYSGCPYVFD